MSETDARRTGAAKAPHAVDEQLAADTPALRAFYGGVRHVNRSRPSSRLPRRGDRRRATQRAGASA